MANRSCFRSLAVRRGVAVGLGVVVFAGVTHVMAGAPKKHIPSSRPFVHVEAIPIDGTIRDDRAVKDKRANKAGHTATVGNLEYVWGVQLKSLHKRFGGFSGIEISPDGKRMTLVSDRGHWASARVRRDKQGKLVSFDHWKILPLRDERGAVLSGDAIDAEALRWDKGSWLVSFEQTHRLWRYRATAPLRGRYPARDAALPVALTDAPKNSGIESFTPLSDGSLLAITEGLRKRDRMLLGWVWRRKNAGPVYYKTSDGFVPTDIARMPNGKILVLERRFIALPPQLNSRFRQFSEQDVVAGATLSPETIGEIKPPLIVDNFEGMTVWKRAPDDVRVLIISDDNFFAHQKMLLYEFRLR